MRLLRSAIAGGSVALAAVVTVVASASPSPTPTLDTILAPPPSSSYVEADKTATGLLEGAFDAHQYVTNAGSTNPTQVEATLNRYGFVAGFGRTWVERATRHALVEAVIAFSGGDGAKRWLSASELADKADVNYKAPISVSGIDSYYGAHFVYASSGTFGDAFAFVKGNDFFIVVAVSTKDDLGTSAATQTKAQFDLAPPNTIPTSDWPQQSNGVTSSHPFILVGGITFWVVLIGVVFLLIVRSRRRRLPSATLASAGGVQLSPDLRYWWDGQGWRDTEHEVPPTAQRSADGGYWWDGHNWRQVPRTP